MSDKRLFGGITIAVIVAMLLNLAIQFALAYYNDYASCRRNNALRAPLRSVAQDEAAAADINRQRARLERGVMVILDQRVAAARDRTSHALNVKYLDCGFPPATH